MILNYVKYKYYVTVKKLHLFAAKLLIVILKRKHEINTALVFIWRKKKLMEIKKY